MRKSYQRALITKPLRDFYSLGAFIFGEVIP